MGYGLVTFLILVIDLYFLPILFPMAFKESTWTVWKEILILLWILFSIGLGNLLYTNILLSYPLSFTSILIFQIDTLVIGIIPITTLTIVKQNYLNRKNRLSAEDLSSHLPPHKPFQSQHEIILLSSENGKEKIEVAIRDLIAISSDGNYITVYYQANGNPASILLRNTLQYAETKLVANTPFFKCHRSYLINTSHIIKVKGNSQGYRLVLQNLDEEIPVSRSNSSAMKQLFNR